MTANFIYRTIIFDFDGTLATLTLDFEAMRSRVLDVAQSYLGGDVRFNGYILEWLEDRASELAKSRGRDVAASFLADSHACIEDEEMKAAERGRLFPFTRELLQGLQKGDVRTAVITRNTSQAVSTVFPDIEDHCDCLLARDQVEQVKPNPEHLLQALRTVGGSLEATLMVGDHPIDIATGHQAGTRTAGVTSGRIKAGDFLEAKADHVADNCLVLVRRLSAGGCLPFPSWPPR